MLISRTKRDTREKEGRLGRGRISVGEDLPSVCKALGSMPSTEENVHDPKRANSSRKPAILNVCVPNNRSSRL